MKFVFKKNNVVIIIATTFLTGCISGAGGSGSGSAKPATGITAIPVNTSQLKNGCGAPVFNGNACGNIIFNFTTNPPTVNINVFLPNGLKVPAGSPLASPPNFWLLTPSFSSSYDPTTVSIDNLGRIVKIPSGGSTDPLIAALITPGSLSSNATIPYSITQANNFSTLTFSDIIGEYMYAVNGPSGTFAVAAYAKNSIPSSPGLAFSNFVSQGSNSTITSFSPSIQNCNGVTPVDSITAINTISDIQNNQYLVAAGTESGAVCIFNFIQGSWTSLTESNALGAKISAVQFANFNNNRYLYFVNTISVNGNNQVIGLLRVTLGSNNQVSGLVDLFDLNVYTNIPAGIIFQSLFIDPFNNVYLGQQNSPGNTSGNNVYILLSESTTWQAIALNGTSPNESSVVSSTMLAVDGKTPIVGVAAANSNGVPSSYILYYLSGINN